MNHIFIMIICTHIIYTELIADGILIHHDELAVRSRIHIAIRRTIQTFHVVACLAACCQTIVFPIAVGIIVGSVSCVR